VDKLLEQASVHGVSLHEMIENISSIPVSSMAKNNILAFNELIKKIKEKIKEQTPTQAIETIVKMISYEEYLIKEF
jgi:superfamily I DNA/RNA helicase